MKLPTFILATGPGRYVIQRLEIDGEYRPLIYRHKPLAYHSPAVARAVAKGYEHQGASIRVHDTKGAAQ
jgi:hypothetical protein